jgi:phosphosulfolactate synthase
MKRAFSMIDLPAHPAKPRETGVTMMIDWGLPPTNQADILDFSGELIDLAKVAVGISGLISEDALRHKLTTYQQAGVEPFPGGMYLELALKQEKVEEYYAECERVGYNLIEVSDNVVHFSESLRERLIRQAVEEYGLRVLGEVGSKREQTDLKTLIADIQSSLTAGAWKVFVEAAEFVTPDGPNTDLIAALLQEVNSSDIIFELAGKWIPGVQAHQIYRLMVWLVDYVGPEVNIGNVAPEDVLPLETLRTGVGVNMKL